VASRVVTIARELVGAGRERVSEEEIAVRARLRIDDAPLEDALLCLSLAGDPSWLTDAEASTTFARVDLLLYEAGAAALSVPELGAWLWRDSIAKQLLFYDRARGSLMERSLAARLLAVAAEGLPRAEANTSASLAVAGAATRLASHPEPSVWIPAVRGLGRLAGRIPGIRFQLVRWLDSARASERRRAVTALASVPVARGNWVEEHVLRVLDTADPWQLAALGPAVPYLVRERAELWQQVSARMLERRGPETVWSMTMGLLALARGEALEEETERLLREARARALSARPRSFPEAQLWQLVRRDTDFLDGIDPDPAFPDMLLDRTVRDAVRLGAAAVGQRASSIARSIRTSFDGLLHSVGTTTRFQERGHALAALESCALAAALGTWQPILRATGRDPADIDLEVEAAREHMGNVFAAYLEADALDFALRRAALRALGNLVDAAGPRRTPARAAAFALAAVAGSKWARDLSPDNLKRFRKPVTDLLWRVGDALRSGRADRRDAPALGELVAWWVLCVGGVDLVQLVRHDSAEDEARVGRSVENLRDACHAAVAGASVASWSNDVIRALIDLGARGTVLAQTMTALVAALDAAEYAVDFGLRSELPNVLESLAAPVATLAALGDEPSIALAPATRVQNPPPAAARLLRLALASASGDEPEPSEVLEEWLDGLGPLLRPIVSQAVTSIIGTERAAVESEIRKRRVGPYRKLRRLGGGGHGEVWLVQRDDSARRYVLKVPQSPLSLDRRQRDALNKLLEREAKLLEGLHEAKVAAFHDYGWDGATPYLVLQYLIGVDLHRYCTVRPLSVVELAPIVRDVCLGLRALHEHDIVHRDLKPGNIFLRLQLPREAKEEFETAHRDPRVAPVAEAVLIDFGVARLIEDPSAIDFGNVEGTLGYLAPEQAESSAEITPKADLYGLGATVYTALTRRRFFEDKPNENSELLAHAMERPFDDPHVLDAVRDLPPALVELLAEATELDPAARPDVDEFAERFARI